MTVYILTFQTNSGYGITEVFKNRKDAEIRLKALFNTNFCPEDGDMTFQEYKSYGSHTAKIWKREIK